MKTTTPLQNAVMISSIIGSIMSNYDATLADERKKPINEIRKRIKKFMYKRSRSNKKEFYAAIALSDTAWRECINHFAKNNLQIETISTVIRLYDLYANTMSRYANIHDKQMEAYAYCSSIQNVDIEQTSYKVSDYIIEQLSVFTGIKRKKLNLLKGIK